MADTRLNISELDYDKIKKNLKEFLKSQPEFTDYNFEGSALSVLLNVLSYNTHYNAYYANMLMNEAHLDSAIKRASVVSRAKSLSYTPRSARSATATVDVVVDPSPATPNTIVMPKNTVFRTNNEGKKYSFFTTSTMITGNTNGEYRFENVTLKEGTLLNYQYVVDKESNPNLIFEIPVDAVDTTSIQVVVQNSSTDLGVSVWNEASSVQNVGSDSQVYWIQENFKGRFEIYFGDGVLGRTLNDGNIIRLEYISPSMGEANGAKIFTISGNVEGYTNVNVITKSPAEGGADKETVDSIKFYAPKAYAAQERVVIPDDYETFIVRNYADVESVKVWGGENNNPPVYGKVFCSIKPLNGNYVSEQFKQELRDRIKNYSVMPILEFVDANYLYVGVAAKVRVDLTSSFRTPEQIKATVKNTIIDYFDVELEKFDKALRYSKLTRVIDSVDSGIVSSSVNLRIMSQIERSPRPISVNIDFNNPIKMTTLQSTAFNVLIGGVERLCYLTDAPSTMPPSNIGTLRLVDFNTKEILNSNYGTIDYARGTIAIAAFSASSIPINYRIYVYAEPDSLDVTASKNTIILLDKNPVLYSINQQVGIPEVELIGIND